MGLHHLLLVGAGIVAGLAPGSPVGTPAPRLGLPGWIGTKSLEVADLRGQVVLLRWWTDTCPYCAASAPALREMDRKYRDQGLRVIGVFHPKPSGEVREERVKAAAGQLGFTFPIAIDPDWAALRRFWPVDEPGAWTSVTFLVDRSGVIQWVHPGGEYHDGSGGAHQDDHAACNRAYRDLEATIRRLVQEP